MTIAGRVYLFLSGIAVGILLAQGEWEPLIIAAVVYGAMMAVILLLARKYPKETDG